MNIVVRRISIGPLHPSLSRCGPLRLVADIEGDTVLNVEPHVGFSHRGLEKLVEGMTYAQAMPLMEKLDYLAPLACSDVYVATVESALEIDIGESASYMRTALLELQRIASHLFWLASLAEALGQQSLTGWAMNDRDGVMRLLEEAGGSRASYLNMRVGGFKSELQPGFAGRADAALEMIGKNVKEYGSFLEGNPTFGERMKGVGALGRRDALSLGVTGPVLRASGVRYDVRSEYPYYAYRKLGFRPQAQTGGDCFARYKIRMLELKESMRLVGEALELMPEGNGLGLPIRLTLPNAKRQAVMTRRETPRGECTAFLFSDLKKPYRLSIRAPSFINLAALGRICEGCRPADLLVILASLDVVMSDVDR